LPARIHQYTGLPSRDSLLRDGCVARWARNRALALDGIPLLATGHDTATHLQGGMLTWDDAGFGTEPGAPAAVQTPPSRVAIPACAAA